MISNFLKVFFFLSFINMCSCQDSKKNDIDSIVLKYNTHDFSLFKKSFIAIRQENKVETIYMLGDSESSKPLYFIHYDKVTKNVTNVNRSLLQKLGTTDYYTDEQIKLLISDFIKYNFKLLSVDNDNNVFINPFNSNAPASLLRLNKGAGLERIKMGNFYRHYKENWYIID